VALINVKQDMEVLAEQYQNEIELKQQNMNDLKQQILSAITQLEDYTNKYNQSEQALDTIRQKFHEKTGICEQLVARVQEKDEKIATLEEQIRLKTQQLREHEEISQIEVKDQLLSRLQNQPPNDQEDVQENSADKEEIEILKKKLENTFQTLAQLNTDKQDLLQQLTTIQQQEINDLHESVIERQAQKEQVLQENSKTIELLSSRAEHNPEDVATITKLSEDVSDLSDRVLALVQEKEKFNNEISKLGHQIEQRDSVLGQERDKFNKMILEEKENFNTEITKLVQQLEQRDSDLDQEREKLNSIHEKGKIHEQQLKQKDEQTENLMSQLNTKSKLLEDQIQFSQNQTAQIQKLQRQVSMITETNSALKKEIAQIRLDQEKKLRNDSDYEKALQRSKQIEDQIEILRRQLQRQRTAFEYQLNQEYVKQNELQCIISQLTSEKHDLTILLESTKEDIMKTEIAIKQINDAHRSSQADLERTRKTAEVCREEGEEVRVRMEKIMEEERQGFAEVEVRFSEMKEQFDKGEIEREKMHELLRKKQEEREKLSELLREEKMEREKMNEMAHKEKREMEEVTKQMEARAEEYAQLKKYLQALSEEISRKDEEILTFQRKIEALEMELGKNVQQVPDFSLAQKSAIGRENLSEVIENLIQEKSALESQLQHQFKIIQNLSETHSTPAPRTTSSSVSNSDLVSMLNKEKRDLSDLLFQKTLTIEDLLQQKRTLLQNTKQLEVDLTQLKSTFPSPIHPSQIPLPSSPPPSVFTPSTHPEIDIIPLPHSMPASVPVLGSTMNVEMDTGTAVGEGRVEQPVVQGRNWLINPVGYLWRSVVGSQ